MFERPNFSNKSKVTRKALIFLVLIFFFITVTKTTTNFSQILSLLAISTCAFLYLFFSNLQKSSKIHLFHNQNFSKKNVSLEKLTYLKDAQFIPTPYLSHPLLQAIYNHKTSLFKADFIPITFHREYIRLLDCGQVSLDSSFIDCSKKKILIIIHGLTGGSEMPYVRSMVQEAHKEGFNALVFHNRGINKTFLTTPEPFNGSNVDDFDFAMKYIREKYKDYDFYIVGFSFGANQLMRYLGNKANQECFKAAVAISLPFDCQKTCESIDGTLYARTFVKQYIKKIIKPNYEILKKSTKNINFEEVFAAKTAKHFHEQFSIKLFGYETVEEYMKASSITIEMLDKIQIPVLILNSKDDNISIRSEAHIEAITRNENILYAETEKGGHVCWFTGANPTRWYPKPTIQFLKSF